MLDRRKFIRHAMIVLAASAGPGRAATGNSVLTSKLPETWLDKKHKATLPKGASLRIVAQSGSPALESSDYIWHGAPDGGACFATENGGWVYVSNSELGDRKGGAGALHFSAKGELVDSYSILQNTSRNCAGGRSLWHTWLSCEENGDAGQVYECDPFGKKPSRVLPAMGSFNHEAVAMDPETGIAYMTEDMSDGCLYRFIPKTKGDLGHGQLEVGILQERKFTWLAVPDPSASKNSTRYQIKAAARFRGGEGMVYSDGKVFFTTKIDNRVWSLNLQDQTLSLVYDAHQHKNPVLTGVDNIEVSPNGELLVAEDGGNMQIVALTHSGEALPLLTLHNQHKSEVTGPAFSPDGSKVYFSSQRGFTGNSNDGITYELSLPWMVNFSSSTS